MEQIHLNQEQLEAVKKIEKEILVEVDRICRKHDIPYTLAYGTLIGAIRHQGFIPWDDDVDICMLREDYERFKEICKTELDPKYFYQSHETDQEYFYLFDKIRANNTVFQELFLAEHSIHTGIYIDVFPVDNIEEGSIKRWWQQTKFHFYRTGLMTKYGNLAYRTGKKKLAAQILRVLYAPFSLETLYRKALKTATSCKNSEHVYGFCPSDNKKNIYPRTYYTNTVDVQFEDVKLPAPAEYDTILRSMYGDYMQFPPEAERKTIHKLIAFSLDAKQK